MRGGRLRTAGRLILATVGLGVLFLRRRCCASPSGSLPTTGRAAADLLIAGALLMSVVVLALDAMERWRVSALRPGSTRARTGRRTQLLRLPARARWTWPGLEL